MKGKEDGKNHVLYIHKRVLSLQERQPASTATTRLWRFSAAKINPVLTWAELRDLLFLPTLNHFTPVNFFFNSFTPLLLVWPCVRSLLETSKHSFRKCEKIGFLIKIRVMHKDFHPDWMERKRPPFGLRIARPLSGDSKRKAPLQEHI